MYENPQGGSERLAGRSLARRRWRPEEPLPPSGPPSPVPSPHQLRCQLGLPSPCVHPWRTNHGCQPLTAGQQLLQGQARATVTSRARLDDQRAANPQCRSRERVLTQRIASHPAGGAVRGGRLVSEICFSNACRRRARTRTLLQSFPSTTRSTHESQSLLRHAASTPGRTGRCLRRGTSRRPVACGRPRASFWPISLIHVHVEARYGRPAESTTG